MDVIAILLFTFWSIFRFIRESLLISLRRRRFYRWSATASCTCALHWRRWGYNIISSLLPELLKKWHLRVVYHHLERERENDFCICFFSVGLKFWFVCQRLKILNNWISQSELNFHSFFPVIHLKFFPSLFLLLHDIPTHNIYHCNLFFKFFKNNKISRVLDLIIFNLHLFIDSNLINERIYWFIISSKRNNLWITQDYFQKSQS